MTTQEFFTTLEQHQDKSLLFEYAPNAFVGANYHITEIKHITIDSVDCGSQTDQWNETVIQLWESPSEKEKTDFMTVYKALGILNKVGQMKPYDLNSEIKFEYSNSTFHTAQLFVNDFIIQNDQLILKLVIKKTDCKAKELCGTPETTESKPDNFAQKATACCTPESGCC